MVRPRRAPDETTPSIYKGYDGLWHARVAMRIKVDGSTERKHVRRKDRGELVKVVRGLERSRDNGSYSGTEDDPTLAQWIGHWLSAILPMSARPKTLATYCSQMERHLLPALGHYRLSELRPEHLGSLYLALQRDGASVPTVRAVHRVLRSALNEANKRRRLPHNPAQVARPPRLVEKEIESLTVDECRRVLATAAGRRNGARWSIALSLGLRQGEALGLLWSDLDLDDGTPTVRRSAQRVNWRHGCPLGSDGPTCGRKRAGSCPRRRDGGLVLVEPKTKASRRTIVLPNRCAMNCAPTGRRKHANACAQVLPGLGSMTSCLRSSAATSSILVTTANDGDASSKRLEYAECACTTRDTLRLPCFSSRTPICAP